MAFVSCWSVLCRSRQRKDLTTPISYAKTDIIAVVISIAFVWGALWLTGKNSGEAARLWIMFLPWLIWLTMIQFEEFTSTNSDIKFKDLPSITLLSTQFLVCLLTVIRVSGFHSETGNTG